MFGDFGSKIRSHVQFNHTLELAPYCSDNANVKVRGHRAGCACGGCSRAVCLSQSARYSLYGVLVHLGSSTHSGHYYSFVKSPNSTWYRMDDDSVSAVSSQQVLRQQAYMLFYTRV